MLPKIVGQPLLLSARQAWAHARGPPEEKTSEILRFAQNDTLTHAARTLRSLGHAAV